MGLKDISLVTVATVQAADPSLYRPPKSGPTGKAVIIAKPPTKLLGAFVGHAGDYAEWNVNDWAFKRVADFPGVTIFDESTGSFYLIGPSGLVGPIGGASYPAPPTSPDGQYVLSCFVVGATQEYVWVSMG